MTHMHLKAHKTALRTHTELDAIFWHHVDFARVAFNAARSEFFDGLERNQYLSLYDIKKLWNSKKRTVFPEFATCSQNVAKHACHNFWNAVQRWYAKQNRVPKRKTRQSKPSFQIDNGVDSVRFSECRRYVILPKIGRVRLKEQPRYPGVIRRATISYKAGTWYLSYLVEVDAPEPPDMSHLPPAGCDVGITYLARMDDGTVYENPRALKVHERQLRRASRAASRKRLGSKNCQKANANLAKLHNRIANIRMDAHHQATHRILRDISVLGIESLTVKGLMKNRKLSKALADAALGGLLVKMKYKAVRRGILIVEAERFWPSTKRCSSCGYVKPSMPLSEREYHCGICGFIEDRDINAAINLRQLAASTADSLNACSETSDGTSVSRDAVRPTLVGWHRNPHVCGGSRKPLTEQMLLDYSRL